MRLSELAAYAKEKYHIAEQFKWAEYPGYSVLTDPYNEKWAALLMRRWDPDLGEEIELCDMRCGREVLREYCLPYLSQPFRMHGDRWIGVRFDSGTDPDVVCTLLDKAIEAGRLHGFTIVLEDDKTPGNSRYQDTPLPFEKGVTGLKTAPVSAKAEPAGLSDALIPGRILKMRQLYRYGVNTPKARAENFYTQGKYMENYEDDAPWNGELRHFFPTYHDLRIHQLRGYFTWRTGIRKGVYQETNEVFVYIYLYELLNGIGAEGAEDSLRKMQEFETGYLDAGFGSSFLRRNLHRWMLELSVIRGLDPAAVRRYADEEQTDRESALLVLRSPDEHSSEEIFSALCVYGGDKYRNSKLIQKTGEEGKRLFAAVWQYAASHFERRGKDLFTACFGRQMEFMWHPLENAVFWQQEPLVNADYVLNECHSYSLRNGEWRERSYYYVYFDKQLFDGLMHETDRRLRLYLKTGHPLKEYMDDAWVVPYIEAVIEEDRKAKAEAMKPKIRIRFDDLEQIRKDASKTRDSLLTEEEKGDTEETRQETQAMPEETSAGQPLQLQDGILKEEQAFPETRPEALPLDGIRKEALALLLQGLSVKPFLRSRNLMAEVFADQLNEAFYDLIGDIIVECDGDEITLVEDYRSDVARILGGEAE